MRGMSGGLVTRGTDGLRTCGVLEGLVRVLEPGCRRRRLPLVLRRHEGRCVKLERLDVHRAVASTNALVQYFLHCKLSWWVSGGHRCRRLPSLTNHTRTICRRCDGDLCT